MADVKLGECHQCYMNRIPNEVLSRIIVLHVQSELLQLPSYKRDLKYQSHTYTTLRLACKRWDETILSTPRLWSWLRMRFNDPLANRESLIIPPEALHNWVTRSGGSSLSIHFDISFVQPSYPDHEDPYIYITKVLDILWSSIDRWNNVAFLLQSQEDIALFAHRSFQGAVRLKDLQFRGSIKHRGPDSPNLSPQVASLFQQLSSIQLASLNLDAANSVICRSLIQCIPVSRLTRLKLVLGAGILLSEGLQICRNCTSLTWLDLESCLASGQQTSATKPIMFPELRILQLSSTCPDTDPNLSLPIIHSPKLEVLSMISDVDDPESTGRLLSEVSRFSPRWAMSC
ncbi:hypothetical protein NP233_g8945 [Leucocoprinus birnbaumii]|uniref:F-box domain-containing protein n=1 Tax=Leucocoprinus birnbaumii TaxID=56174 RepID=A0AAD5VLC8_9AGAR|nr:hypothetical protein NP233_g8945 [Leucocoprinus birnbaumii]